MEQPSHIYLKIEIDDQGNPKLVGAWEGEPEIDTEGFGSVFPCRHNPGCYCIIYNGREIPVYCPGSATYQKESK